MKTFLRLVILRYGKSKERYPDMTLSLILIIYRRFINSISTRCDGVGIVRRYGLRIS